MVPQAYGKHYISLTGMYKRSNVFRAPGRRGRGRWSGQPAFPRRNALQGHWLSLCSLGGRGARASGRAEARPHARALQGRRLDVQTELPIVCVCGSVSTYIQNCQLFVYVRASRRTYRIASCMVGGSLRGPI